MPLAYAICMATCGSGVKTTGMKITKVLQLTGVLGLLIIKKRIAYYVAVPGSTLRGIAALRIATTMRPTAATTMLVFE